MTRPVDQPPAREPLTLAVAAHGLPSRHNLPTEPVEPAAWSRLVRAVVEERLEGHLARAVADGALAVSDEQHAAAAAVHRSAMATVLLCESRLVTLAPALDALGATWRVLKGSAVAHLDHADPADRAYGDLDLLVDGPRISAVIAHLLDLGGRRAFNEPRPGFDERFGKGAAVHLPDGSEVDVHRTLALGPFGVRLDPELLLAAAPASFVVGGRTVAGLDQPWRLLHACYHAALGRHPARLSAQRDVLQLLPSDGSLDLVDAVASCGGRAVVAAALVEAADALRPERPHPLVTWARHVEPTMRERRWLSAYRGPRRSSRRRTVLVLEALPGTAARMSYARAVADSARQRPDRPLRP